MSRSHHSRARDPVGVQLGERDGGDEAADLSELSLQGFRGGSLILVQQIPRTIDPDETTDSIQQASPGRADVDASSPVLVCGGCADQGVAVLGCVEPLSPMTPRQLGSVQPLLISPAPCEEDQHNQISLQLSALFSPWLGCQEEAEGSPMRDTASQLVCLSLISAPTAPSRPLQSSPGFIYDRSAMLATNMLHLVHQNPAMLRMWASQMAEGVPRGRRDCLDLAGKLPLCLKALDIGIHPSRLMIDAAQAGGVY